MARLVFDSGGMVADPELILLTKSGKRLGMLAGVDNVHYANHLNSANEISFRVHKMVDGQKNPLWDDLVDFKVIWYRSGANETFEISVEIDESDETIKNVAGKALGESELSQLYLYDVEINTEDDIARDDYTEPTVFYNENDPSSSLLNRVLDKAPHYQIDYVDYSLRPVQRTFTFDNKSIADALTEIAEEVGCIFVYGTGISYSDSSLVRNIRAYDLMNVCRVCGKRFEGQVCPDCGSTEYMDGYGSDTGIVIARENLADSITYSSDTGATKNCFRLVAGDDEMTAAIRACNPNGSSYIWNITDDMRADMSAALVNRLAEYDALYEEYATTKQFEIDATEYNAVVDKYKSSKPELRHIYSGGTTVSGEDIELTGTSSLIDAEYAILDLSSYLNTTMMPSYQYWVPPAATQCATIASSITTVGVTNLNTASAATVALAIKALAKCYAHTEVYKVDVETQSYSKPTWTGYVTLTSYSDEEDTATTSLMTVTASSSEVTYAVDLVQKKITEYGEKKYDITDLFNMSQAAFEDALTEYSLDCLKSFDECCQACLAVLIDQGAGAASATAYTVYQDYRDKLAAIEEEMAVRTEELDIVGTYEGQNGLLQSMIGIINKVHRDLDFQAFLEDMRSSSTVGPAQVGYATVGDNSPTNGDLWREFIAYRREQEYSNSNYASDGLTSAEVIRNAREFYNAAKAELYKSSTLQHSISASLANLLVMDEFAGLVDNFETGNWIYVIADEHPYKLRLVTYEIDFGAVQKIDVEFSDMLAIANGVSDLKSVLDSARSIASSYGAVAKQASSGGSAGKTLESIYAEGLDATKAMIMSNANHQDMQFGDSGLLGRRFVDEIDDYSPEQCRLINTNLVFTRDNWETVSTALGKIIVDGVEYYGLIGDVIVGKLGQFVQVNAENITAGLLTDATGTNYWNLDTGEFRLSTYAPKEDTIADVDVEYAVGNSSSTAPSSGWDTASPTWSSGQYVWQRTKITDGAGVISYSDPVCIQGAAGAKGDPGIPGSSYYVYIRYSAHSDGTDMHTAWQTGDEYIGIYTGTASAAPSTPSSYTWSKFTGEDGSDGIPGTPGTDGTPAYVHLAYADNEPATLETRGGDEIVTRSGDTFETEYTFSTTSFDGATWIGVYTDSNIADSDDPNDYTWSKIRGRETSTIEDEYYLSTSDEVCRGGYWSTEQPEWSDGHYLWTRSKITYTDGGTTTVEYTDPIIAAAINSANEAVSELDQNLDSEGVFNRLTNNGQLQGIYMEDDELYINGTYIKTGTLDANLIKAGRIQDKQNSNYWDMTTGEFKLSSATTVGGSTVSSIASSAASSAVTTYDNGLGQTAVYNKLIGSDTSPGITLSNGQLFINANRINAGTIGAAYINVSDLLAQNITATGLIQFSNDRYKITSNDLGDVTISVGGGYLILSGMSIQLDGSSIGVSVEGVGGSYAGTMEDMIVASGKSGNWRYCTTAKGYSWFTGSHSVTPTSWTQDGSMYYSSPITLAAPVTLSGSVVVVGNTTSNLCYVANAGAGSTTGTISFRLMCPINPGTSFTATVRLFCSMTA